MKAKMNVQMNVQIIKHYKFHSIRNTVIKNWAVLLRQKLLRHLPPKKRKILKLAKELVVVFVAEAEGRRLNKHFRKKNYATDVLSFSSILPNSLGELVFCVPILVKKARAHDLTLQEETLYLFIHGLLHLLGYDHEQSKAKARSMYSLQDQLFAEMTGR